MSDSMSNNVNEKSRFYIQKVDIIFSVSERDRSFFFQISSLLTKLNYIKYKIFWKYFKERPPLITLSIYYVQSV